MNASPTQTDCKVFREKLKMQLIGLDLGRLDVAGEDALCISEG